jgi:putative transposase
VNHKRVYRIYREAGLCLKRKKRKHCVRIGVPQMQLTADNQEWAMDFAHDVLAAGRSIRVLSIVEAFTRECLALEVDTGFASRRVTRALDQIIAERGKPLAIRCDNGRSLPVDTFWPGAWIARSNCGISSLVRRRRTRMWRVFMGDYARSVCA